MKVLAKIAVFFFVFNLLAFAAIICVHGEDAKLTASELYVAWQENGWPEDVGGFYIDSGKYVISVVDINDARINEIKSSISDQDNVDFVNCKYSYNELETVFAQLDKQVWAAGNVRTLGIDIKENYVGIGVSPEEVDEFRQIYGKLYGDRVSVYAQGPIVAVSNYNFIVIGVCITAILLLIAIAILLVMLKKIKVRKD